MNVSGKKLRHSFLTVIETYHDVFYLQKMDQSVNSLATRSSSEMAQVGQSISSAMMPRLRKSVSDPYGNYFLIDDLKGVVYKMSAQGRVLGMGYFWGVNSFLFFNYLVSFYFAANLLPKKYLTWIHPLSMPLNPHLPITLNSVIIKASRRLV